MTEGGDSAPPKPPFTDIKKSKFAKDIAWLFASDITAGCSKTKFCPNDPVTREQIVLHGRRPEPAEVEKGLLPRR